jgi:hypothetical protein
VFCQSLKLGFTDLELGFTVIAAKAGIQIAALGSRLRGNDVTQKLRFDKARSPSRCLFSCLSCVSWSKKHQMHHHSKSDPTIRVIRAIRGKYPDHNPLNTVIPVNTVIPAQAGIQIAALDSRRRGNDVRKLQA